MFASKNPKNLTTITIKSLNDINGDKEQKTSHPNDVGQLHAFPNAVYQSTDNIFPSKFNQSSSSSTSSSQRSFPKDSIKSFKDKKTPKDWDPGTKLDPKHDSFVYSNHGYHNSAFVRDTYYRHIPPITRKHLNGEKPSDNKKRPKSTNDSVTNDNKTKNITIISVPFSHNSSSSLPQRGKLLSPSSSSSNLSSGYSSHSASMPTLSSSSSSSTLKASDTTLLSKNSKRPDDLWLSRFESTLKSTAKDDQYVTSDQVKDALQVKESFFTNRFVELFKQERDGQIAVERMMGDLRALVCGTDTDKLRFLFNMYNTKGNGQIVRSELQQFFTNCIEEYRLQISQENVQALTAAFFQAADQNRDGKISFEELRSLFQRRPFIVDHISIRPGLNLNDNTRVSNRFRHFSKTYFLNNLKKVMTMIVFVLINVVLMGLGMHLNWDKNAWTKRVIVHVPKDSKKRNDAIDDL